MLVEVEGELHGPSSQRWSGLMRGVLKQRAAGIVVDLRGCRGIDADCLEALVSAAATVKARGGSGAALVMLPGSELANRLGRLVGEELLIHSSVDDALRALGERTMPVPFLVRLERKGEVAILAVEGEFDLASKDEFQEQLDKAIALKAPLIVDLEHCRFIDSTGIAQVVRSFELAADRGFALAASGPQVHRVLNLVGIPEYIPTFDTREDALRALAS
jgi:anti-anti-sigma factor